MRKLFLCLIGCCVLALGTQAANWNDVKDVTPIERQRPAGVSNGIYYGADHGDAAADVYEEDLLFVDGKLTINCTMGSYICIKGHMGNFYRSKTPTTIADTQVTFDWQNGWANGQQWAIPEGINYIIMRSASWKGQIVLERVDKATYDAYHYGNGKQGIENTEVREKAHKVFVDGQLRIVRGDKMFDATGKEVKSR